MESSPRSSNPGKSGSRTSRKQANGRRFRGLTCSNCRARKVRCEGSQPTCKTCEIYQVECHYDKTPSMSQVVAMAKRLQETEKLIEELRASREDAGSTEEDHPPSPSAEHVRDDDEEDEADASAASFPARLPSRQAPVGVRQRGDDQQTRTPESSIGTASGVFVPPPGSATAVTDMSAPPWPHVPASARPLLGPGDPGGAHDLPHAATELTVDEHGKVCYYGPTSAVHDPPSVESPASSSVQTYATRPSAARMDVHSSLSSCVREMATWEEFALGNASLQTGIPRQIMAKLLHLYWTWVSPMFMWVFRPAFIRDMATGGPYYSEFLLTVMCGHAAKYHDGTCAEFLLTRARRLLGTAIQQPSSIPTVQALLQLSARDLAQGSISQAWVYSGIAFRMASDLGLQHSSNDIKGLGPVDIEARRRLFWGCYFWDKATSLYAGRLPAVTELLDPNSLNMLDVSTDHEVWVPSFADPLSPTRMVHRDGYPPRQNHAVSCFVNSCRLAIIINDIVVQLYSKRNNRSMTESSLRDIKVRLGVWRAESPAHLKYDVDNLPTICPPPHIISQNLLYFTSVILAHRPFWSAPSHYKTCIAASESIEKLVLLLESTFGLENITYLMGYCIYTGASAILEDAKGGNEAAHATLRTFLRALNAGMQRCPLLERSLNIIVKGMSSVPPQRRDVLDHQHHLNSGTNASMPMAYNYIPAFPYIDPSVPIDFDVNAQVNCGTYMDLSTGLDCYPEMQLDLGDYIGPAL